MASSVLPTPAGPSTSTGLPSRPARYDTSAVGLVGQVADLPEPLAGVLDRWELAAHPLEGYFRPRARRPRPSCIADFLDPGDGPSQSGDFRVSPTFFIVLLGLGFLIGTLGHIMKSRTLVAVGVLSCFAATVFLPIAYAVSH